MRVNLTLVIQITHLWVTVFLLRRFLMKPLLDALEKKRKYKALLTDRMCHEKETIDEIQACAKVEILDFQKNTVDLREPLPPQKEVAVSAIEQGLVQRVGDAARVIKSVTTMEEQKFVKGMLDDFI